MRCIRCRRDPCPYPTALATALMAQTVVGAAGAQQAIDDALRARDFCDASRRAIGAQR